MEHRPTHHTLLAKLQRRYNFHQSTIQFFRSYFTDRKQFTRTQHAQSRQQTITDGIPQGSTLSTTLFILYFDDDIYQHTSSPTTAFADDSSLVLTANTVTELEELAQSNIHTYISHLHANGMLANIGKSSYTLFYPKRPSARLHLRYAGEDLQHKEETKSLGITIQHNLKHHSTIATVMSKLGAALALMKAASPLLDYDDLLSLYYRHAQPALTYGITIWGTIDPTKGYLKPLLRVQKRIVHHMSCGAHYKPYTRRGTDFLMAAAGILSVHTLYAYRVASTVHKFLHANPNDHLPTHIHNYPQLHQLHHHRTRRATPTHYTLYAAPHMGPLQTHYIKLWNDDNIVPPAIRRIPDRKTFKAKLKRHLLTYQLDTLSTHLTI